jgi:uncharacterized protein
MPQASPGEARPALDRLVVNVSQDCNLRCRYCYAGGGAYGGSRGLLDLARGREFVDYFLTAFGGIRSIQFFGGEPFLNVAVLDGLCAHALERSEAAGLPPPRLSVVTNGTILSEAILATIRARALSVTVSLDGPKAVNDLQRVTPSGAGSYERVVETIRTMKRETGQPAQIEGAFTASHLEGRFSLVDFMDFLVGELDVHLLHMPWVLGEGFGGAGIVPRPDRIDALVATYGDAVSRSVASLAGPGVDEAILLSFVERRLRSLLAEAADDPQVCAAGTGTLSVDVDGGIYPCFMFTNKPPFRLGVVGTTTPAELRSASLAFASRLATAPADGPRPLMSCAGMNEELGGGVDRLPPGAAEVSRRLVDRLDEELAPFRRDEERWSWVKTKLALLPLVTG